MKQYKQSFENDGSSKRPFAVIIKMFKNYFILNYAKIIPFVNQLSRVFN